MTPVKILLVVLLGCVVIWGTWAILGAFGITDPIRTVVQVLIVVLIVAWGYKELGGPNIT